MTTVTVEDAQARLPELIAGLTNGDEVVIVTAGDRRPVARLFGPLPPRVPGAMAGTALYMAPDFDAPLGDFGGTWSNPTDPAEDALALLVDVGPRPDPF